MNPPVGMSVLCSSPQLYKICACVYVVVNLSVELKIGATFAEMVHVLSFKITVYGS